MFPLKFTAKKEQYLQKFGMLQFMKTRILSVGVMETQLSAVQSIMASLHSRNMKLATLFSALLCANYCHPMAPTSVRCLFDPASTFHRSLIPNLMHQRLSGCIPMWQSCSRPSCVELSGRGNADMEPGSSSDPLCPRRLLVTDDQVVQRPQKAKDRQYANRLPLRSHPFCNSTPFHLR